jgi:hypothetical protein
MSSVFSNTQFTNIPRDASYPYGHPYLSSRLPQTHYPWDSVYDTRYQRDVQHPKYQWHGHMEYPYYVRRHRIPKVFTEPKPIEFASPNGYSYQIPQYPPYVYWYPNPVECRDACGTKVCEEYHRRMNNYRMCKFCQTLKRPMCFDPRRQSCVPCRPEQALARCEDNFGCRNPNGWMHDNVEPINPKYTGCQLCN